MNVVVVSVFFFFFFMLHWVQWNHFVTGIFNIIPILASSFWYYAFPVPRQSRGIWYVMSSLWALPCEGSYPKRSSNQPSARGMPISNCDLFFNMPFISIFWTAINLKQKGTEKIHMQKISYTPRFTSLFAYLSLTTYCILVYHAISSALVLSNAELGLPLAITRKEQFTLYM